MTIPSVIQQFIESHLQYVLMFLHHRLWGYYTRRYPNHWLTHLDQHLNLAEAETQCASYHKGSGRGHATAHPVPRLLRGLLLKYLTNSSYRQTEELVDCHTFYKVWVGYALFEAPFDHTTLQRFEIWLMEHHPRLIFDLILSQVDPKLKGQRQFVDTYALVARAANGSLLDLLRNCARQLLLALREEELPLALEIEATLKLEVLAGIEGEKPNYALNEAEHKTRLEQLAAEIIRLQQQVAPLFEGESPHFYAEQQPQIARWHGYLTKILAEQLDISETGIRELPLKEKGSYRIISANDPEATLRYHGKETDLGYNVSVLTDDHFVREVQVDTGSTPDNLGLKGLLEAQKEHQDVVPEEVVGDKAYGTGKVRAEVAEVTEGQTQVVAVLPDFEKRRDYFGPSEFQLDWNEAQNKAELTCPHGQVTTVSYNHKGEGRTFRFSAKKHCQGCPLWDKCRTPESKPQSHRTVYISQYRDEVAQATVFNDTEAFKVAIKLRSQTVERIIFNLTNLHGGRKARSVGQKKAEFQTRMVATAFNIRQLIRLKIAEALAQKSLTREACVL